MIKVRLKDLMWERRIRTLAQVVRESGVSRTVLDRLYNRPDEAEGIQFGTLSRLCRALDCEVGDLLEYVPGPESG